MTTLNISLKNSYPENGETCHYIQIIQLQIQLNGRNINEMCITV
jgi:hypothetical protein